MTKVVKTVHPSNGSRSTWKSIFNDSVRGGRLPGKTGNVTIDRLSSTLWAVREGKDWYDKARSRWVQATTWTVTVEESDPAYLTVQQWLLDELPEIKQKNVTATTKTVYLDVDGNEAKRGLFDDYELGGSSDSNRASKTQVVLSLADTAAMDIDVKGYKVKVRVSTNVSEDEMMGGRPRTRRTSSIKAGKIIFTARSLDAQNAIVDMLNDMVGGVSKRKPSLWVADGWGSWRQQDAPQRKLSSVVLRDGLKEDIIADLQKFLDDEKKYNDLGIPWHRGYLFHGPPGTGKTSLIKAVAAELGLDLWYAPLGDLKEDSSLVDLVRSIRSRGILLLEDVDAYQAAKDREQDGGSGDSTGISSTALFNALDGVVTPHGLITIMTTNHIDKLDPALIRSGRADRTLKLDLPAVSEYAKLWTLFFPNEEQWIVPSPGVPGMSQSDISEIFKRNWDNPEQARKDLIEEMDACAVMLEG